MRARHCETRSGEAIQTMNVPPGLLRPPYERHARNDNPSFYHFPFAQSARMVFFRLRLKHTG
ncbi:MAG: hypothetical protein LBT00_01655 [Spirochaetaceae bacterium]|nr:hypothetical protein [Spirochaetaceae bacterium]